MRYSSAASISTRSARFQPPRRRKDFLSSQKPKKRALLIDRLLERKEFADYWATKWCDLLRVKSEYPINLWPNAVQGYHRWIRTCIKENMPYDRFVREMLTASGSNFTVPPVNFYRAVQSREPTAIAQAVALSFMGVRPESWSKQRWSEMAVFFAKIGYKGTEQWKEEIVMFDPGQGRRPSGRRRADRRRFSRRRRPSFFRARIRARRSPIGWCCRRIPGSPGPR